jgi:hypothetical protein
MNSELDNLIKEARAIAVDAEKRFGELNAAQLNWQPNAESWSVGTCFDHLIKTNSEMCGAAESHIKGTHKATIWERLPFGHKFFGNFVIKATLPENPKKVKSPKVFAPTASDVRGDVVKRFVESHKRVVETLEASREIDSAKIIVTSPVAKFVTYSLLDAYTIIVQHELRHLKQAERVMQSEGFPQ